MSGELLGQLQETLLQAAKLVGQLKVETVQPPTVESTATEWEEFCRQTYGTNNPCAIGIVMRKQLPLKCERCGNPMFQKVVEPVPRDDLDVYRCNSPNCGHREYVFKKG